MNIGFFIMSIHPINKDYKKTLSEERDVSLLADRLGFSEAYCGEHVTDSAENITSSELFIAFLAAETKNIRLGTGTVNMPNSHPAAIAGQIAMLDHMLDGRFNFGISPDVLASDAEVFGNLDKNRNEMFLESIDMVLEIWKRDPSIIRKVVAPFSKGLIAVATRGRHLISANFLMPKCVKMNCPKYNKMQCLINKNTKKTFRWAKLQIRDQNYMNRLLSLNKWNNPPIASPFIIT